MNSTRNDDSAEAFQSLLVKIIIAVYGIISLGFLSNLTVAVVVGNILIRLGRQLPNRHMLVYVLALCIVDALVLGTLPMLITQLYLQRWIFGQTLCTVYWIMESINKTLSTFILTCLSFDRYLAVRFPQRCLHIRTVRGALYILSFCIVFAALILMPVYLHAEVTYVPVDSGHENGSIITVPTCAFIGQSSFVFTVFTLCYFVPFACMSCFYGSMLARLRHKSRKLGLRQGRVRRVTKKTLTLVILYFVFWTPYWVMTLRSVIADATADQSIKSDEDENEIDTTRVTTSATVSSFSSTMITRDEEGSEEGGGGDALSAVTFAVMCAIHSGCYLNSAINPILYALLNRELRRQHYAAMNCTGTRSGTPASTNGNGAGRCSFTRQFMSLCPNMDDGQNRNSSHCIAPSSKQGTKRGSKEKKRNLSLWKLWEQQSAIELSKDDLNAFRTELINLDSRMSSGLYNRLISIVSVGEARRSWPDSATSRLTRNSPTPL